MEFVLGLTIGIFVGIEICRYGVTLIAKDYPPEKALKLFRGELK